MVMVRSGCASAERCHCPMPLGGSGHASVSFFVGRAEKSGARKKDSSVKSQFSY